MGHNGLHLINRRKKKIYSVVSLFSGAGGFDWGFHCTGRFETKLACELKSEPAATLAHNLSLEIHPVAKLHSLNGMPAVLQGDVQDVDFSKIKYNPDVLIGGPPCQDFSITISKSGQERPGLNGGRGKLYAEFVRALMFLQPRFFVFENVEGLLSANSGEAINTILADIGSLEETRLAASSIHDDVPTEPVSNYDIVFCKVVDTPSLGVPQTRRRLIIIGMRKDLSGNLFESTSIRAKFANVLVGEKSTFSKYPMSAIEVFEGTTLDQLNDKYIEIMEAYSQVAEQTFAQEWSENVWQNLKWNIVQDYYQANGLNYETDYQLDEFKEAMVLHQQILTELGWWKKPLNPEVDFVDKSNRLPRLKQSVIDRMSMIPPDQNYAFVDGTQWSVTGKNISFIYRRAHPLKPAWTVMAYGGGGTYGYHYQRDRAQLTLRERARIQTFTDDFEFKESNVRAQIGEAVPPLLGKRIAELIANVLDGLERHLNKNTNSA